MNPSRAPKLFRREHIFIITIFAILCCFGHFVQFSMILDHFCTQYSQNCPSGHASTMRLQIVDLVSDFYVFRWVRESSHFLEKCWFGNTKKRQNSDDGIQKKLDVRVEGKRVRPRTSWMGKITNWTGKGYEQLLCALTEDRSCWGSSIFNALVEQDTCR